MVPYHCLNYRIHVARELPSDANSSTFRGTAVQPLSDAIEDISSLRAGIYAAYRRGPGPDAERLPEDFGQVVEAVVTFRDGVVRESTGADP